MDNNQNKKTGLIIYYIVQFSQQLFNINLMKFQTLSLIFQRFYNYLTRFVAPNKFETSSERKKQLPIQMRKNAPTPQSRKDKKIYKFVLNQVSDSVDSNRSPWQKKTKKISRYNFSTSKKKLKRKLVPKVYQRQNFQQKNDIIQQQGSQNFLNQSGESISPIKTNLNTFQSDTTINQLIQTLSQPNSTKSNFNKPEKQVININEYHASKREDHQLIKHISKVEKDSDQNMKRGVNENLFIKKKYLKSAPIYQAVGELSYEQQKLMRQLKIQKQEQPQLLNKQVEILNELQQSKMNNYKYCPILIVLDQSSQNQPNGNQNAHHQSAKIN